MRKNFICGLDIGTFKICAACGRVDPLGKIDILASQTVPAQGMIAGKIIDSKKVSACVKDVIKKLHKICGIKVHRVYTNIDSPDLRAKMCEEKILFAEKTKIKRFHIDNLINSAVTSKISLDRKFIHAGFKNFTLDNRTNCIYPQGLKAHDLKLNIVVISALIPTIKSFVKCIRAAGLILEDMVPSGYAQSLSFFRDAKPDTEKNDILIDIGAGQIKIFLLKDKLIKDITILPQGARSITGDIAVKLKLSFNCAEQLKIKYGRAHCEGSFFNQKIIVKDRHANKIIQLKHLNEIITLKVEHLLYQIKKALLKLNYEDVKVEEIIITGGGSIMEGFLEKAEEILGRQVKMGFLSAVKDNHIQMQSANYATTVGLILYGFRNRDKKSFLSKQKNHPLTSMLNRAKQLYREYF